MKDCTCTGTCRGPEGLGEGWVCVLQKGPPVGRMIQIADLISELTGIQDRWGNTCVYVRDMSWGAVALNRKADDDKRAAKLVSLEGSDPDDPDIYGN